MQETCKLEILSLAVIIIYSPQLINKSNWQNQMETEATVNSAFIQFLDDIKFD